MKKAVIREIAINRNAMSGTLAPSIAENIAHSKRNTTATKKGVLGSDIV